MSSTSTTTSTRDRALALLGSNVSPEQTAAALGVELSRISQLLSEEQFAASVSQLRFETLHKHNARDREYDVMEDELLVRLRDCLPLMHRPMEVLKAIAVINAAKRRGMSAPETLHQGAQVLQLIMPTQIINHFTKNINNQVIKINDQDLVTIQGSILLERVKEKGKARELENAPQRMQTQ